MNERTSEPWVVYGDNTDIFVGNMVSDSVGACDGIRQVCVVKQGDYEIPDYDEAQANAAYIVRACNSHEALLTALTKITASPYKPNRIPDYADDAIAQIKAIAQAAIKAAQQEGQA